MHTRRAETGGGWTAGSVVSPDVEFEISSEDAVAEASWVAQCSLLIWAKTHPLCGLRNSPTRWNVDQRSPLRMFHPFRPPCGNSLEIGDLGS